MGEEEIGQRLTDLVTVVNECNRNAAAAAGTAMKTQGAVEGLGQQIRQVQTEQQEQRRTLRHHGEDIAALKQVCSERQQHCAAKFDDAADDIKSAVGPLWGRNKKLSEEVKSLRDRVAEVREDSRVLDGKALERAHLMTQLKRWGVLALKLLGALLLAGGAGAGAIEGLKFLLGG
jgi:chromosome segregation ATPase